MTYQSETAGENEIKHWLDTAISMAQTIGFFQNQSGAENSLYCPRMWKRIGWACYMTDCMISLRLRCRPSIKNQDFCQQMLTVDDFEIYNFSAENQCLFTGCTLVQGTKARRDLALICISHAQLCVCISEVLEIQGKAATKIPINRRNDSAYVARAATSDRALADTFRTSQPSPHDLLHRYCGSTSISNYPIVEHPRPPRCSPNHPDCVRTAQKEIAQLPIYAWRHSHPGSHDHPHLRDESVAVAGERGSHEGLPIVYGDDG